MPLSSISSGFGGDGKRARYYGKYAAIRRRGYRQQLHTHAGRRNRCGRGQPRSWPPNARSHAWAPACSTMAGSPPMPWRSCAPISNAWPRFIKSWTSSACVRWPPARFGTRAISRSFWNAGAKVPWQSPSGNIWAQQKQAHSSGHAGSLAASRQTRSDGQHGQWQQGSDSLGHRILAKAFSNQLGTYSSTQIFLRTVPPGQSVLYTA